MEEEDEGDADETNKSIGDIKPRQYFLRERRQTEEIDNHRKSNFLLDFSGLLI